jgi:recombination protein RecT
MSNLPAAIADVRGTLDKMTPQFKAALPSHIDPERFKRVAITAIQTNPDLLKSDRAALLGALVKSAQDGLLPDGREAAIVLFGGKPSYMPMVGGVLKKVRNSGELSTITAQIVCKNDTFSYNPCMDPAPNHSPDWFGDRGEMIGVYAVARLKDGSTAVEIMSKRDIEKIRNVSRSKDNGPWKTWYEEMAKKSVIRRLAKYLPQSSDKDGLHSVLDNDETLTDEPIEDAVVVEEAAPVKRATRMDRVKEAAQEPETQPSDPAEVIDNDGPMYENTPADDEEPF